MRTFIFLGLLAVIAGFSWPHIHQSESLTDKYAEVFKQPTIVGFTMQGCPACRRQKPEWNALRARGYRIVVYDQAQSSDLVEHFGIRMYPTTVVIVDGKVKPRQFVGWTPANVIAGYAPECKEDSGGVDIDIGPLHIEVD